MEWTETGLNMLEAENGYTLERRFGHWMVYTPSGDQPVMIFPHMGYGHLEVDYLPQAKAFAESHAAMVEK